LAQAILAQVVIVVSDSFCICDTMGLQIAEFEFATRAIDQIVVSSFKNTRVPLRIASISTCASESSDDEAAVSLSSTSDGGNVRHAEPDVRFVNHISIPPRHQIAVVDDELGCSKNCPLQALPQPFVHDASR